MSERLVLKLSYDGTEFFGWQVQKNQRTVQGVLAEAWKKICGVYEYPHGSGRTDSGVHAIGQIATFNLINCCIPVYRYVHVLNRNLPYDVRVLGSVLAPQGFDPQRSAISRTYYYDLLTDPYGWHPRDRHYALFLPKKRLYLKRLNALARVFLGCQNFTAFCSSEDQNFTKVRTVLTSAFYALPNGKIRYEIRADSFLMRMVRFIVGNILFCHDKENGVEILKHAIVKQDKTVLGSVIDPVGLTLAYIEYPEYSPRFLRDL